MNVRRILAASVLGLGAVVMAVQVPADLAAQDAKAERKALKLKMLAEKKAAETKKPTDAPDAKPAPTNIKPPEAPAHPMPTAALAQLIDRQIGLKLDGAQVKPSPK